jgi:hypothetical protein
MQRIPVPALVIKYLETMYSSVAWFMQLHNAEMKRAQAAGHPLESILDHEQLPGWQQQAALIDNAATALARIADKWGFDNSSLVNFSEDFNPLVGKDAEIPRDVRVLLQRMEHRAINLQQGKTLAKPKSPSKKSVVRTKTKGQISPRKTFFHSGHDENDGEWSDPLTLAKVSTAVKETPQNTKRILSRTGLIQKTRQNWIVKVDDIKSDWADAILAAKKRIK